MQMEKQRTISFSRLESSISVSSKSRIFGSELLSPRHRLYPNEPSTGHVFILAIGKRLSFELGRGPQEFHGSLKARLRREREGEKSSIELTTRNFIELGMQDMFHEAD